MSYQIVDAYSHCGLSKYRPVENVQDIMRRNGVARAVLVQHLGEYDNHYLETVVAKEPHQFAGVMHLDVADPAIDDLLEHWASKHIFRGIRLLTRTLTTHLDVWEHASQLGLSLILFDEHSIAHHFNELSDFAEQHPRTRMVLSHLGVLDMREAPNFSSHQQIVALAAHANIFVQISGMHMFSQPPYTDLVPLIEQLWDAYGPQRLLYGSNYPVMGEDPMYEQEIDLLKTGRLGIPVDDLEQVLSKTATELWFE